MIIGQCAEVFQDFAIEEEGLSSCLIESMRLEIEQCITTESMNLARMSAFDIMRGDLKLRNAPYFCVLANEDIRLVNAQKELVIRMFDPCHAFDGNISMIGGYGEQI